MQYAHPQSPTKVRAFSAPIHGRKLNKHLMFAMKGVARHTGHKLPADLEGDCFLRCPSASRGDSYFPGEHHFTVKKAAHQGKPRIFIHCACGMLVPFGRIEQHAHDPKFGTVEASQ